jgi:hypothetical protein
LGWGREKGGVGEEKRRHKGREGERIRVWIKGG